MFLGFGVFGVCSFLVFVLVWARPSDLFLFFWGLLCVFVFLLFWFSLLLDSCGVGLGGGLAYIYIYIYFVYMHNCMHKYGNYT